MSRKGSLAAAIGAQLVLAGSAVAGFERLATEVKPNEAGILTCNLYVQFDGKGNDFISWVGGTADLPLSVGVVEGTFFQSPFNGDLPPNANLCALFPLECLDTFVTIGRKTNDGDDFTNLSSGWPGFGAGSLELGAPGGGWYVAAGEPQGQPDETDRVLIMQLSTEDGQGFRGVLGFYPDQYAAFDSRLGCDLGPDVVIDVGHSSNILAMGDLDGDGDLDLVVSSSQPGDLSILMNDGDGTFAGEAVIDVFYPASVAIGDLDGDLDLDLAMPVPELDAVWVLPNNGDGTFGAAASVPAGDSPVSIVPGDLDGDLDLDIVAANWYSAEVSILLNAGDGTFAGPVAYQAGTGPRSVVLGDLDGDGDLDVVAGLYAGSVATLFNSGDGTLSAPTASEVGAFARSVALGDLDGDGDLDVVASKDEDTPTEQDGTIAVFLNGGDGTLAPQVPLTVGILPMSVATSDLDGDGDVDIAVTRWTGVVGVMLNDGKATFFGPLLHGTGGYPDQLGAGDLDGDLDLDMVVASEDGVSVHLRQCACPSDLDGDGTVSITDLLDLLGAWGNPWGVTHLLDLLAAWGPCP